MQTTRLSDRFPILKACNLIVIVAALGYFVDIYDLVLFGIVRVASLQDLGLSGTELFNSGVFLLNMQMLGMLIGGILWGIFGDKKGRLSVLFGSIIMYSIANIANGFVHSVEAYALWRFIAGVGLAGELGAGITLVSETLPKELRGYGTMIVAAIGVSGAVVAGFIADFFTWRTNYFIGGGLGILLLFLRIGVFESEMYKSLEKKDTRRGHFWTLLTERSKLLRYIQCILIGLPLWYVVGVLITFSPELAIQLGITEPIKAGKALMYCYLGLVIGDAASGYLSQKLQSRRKIIGSFLLATSVLIGFYLLAPFPTATLFYATCFAIGIPIGYWAVFVTVAAEQFGTNLRSTVATTVPNFVRGSVIPITFLFSFLKDRFGIVSSAALVGGLCIVAALWALIYLEETYHKDLDYLEV